MGAGNSAPRQQINIQRIFYDSNREALEDQWLDIQSLIDWKAIAEAWGFYTFFIINWRYYSAHTQRSISLKKLGKNISLLELTYGEADRNLLASKKYELSPPNSAWSLLSWKAPQNSLGIGGYRVSWLSFRMDTRTFTGTCVIWQRARHLRLGRAGWRSPSETLNDGRHQYRLCRSN